MDNNVIRIVLIMSIQNCPFSYFMSKIFQSRAIIFGLSAYLRLIEPLFCYIFPRDFKIHVVSDILFMSGYVFL